MNFSVFLGHPGNAHFVPKNPQPAKKKVKSKRKTDRDNERAAKFQERKRKEAEAAVSAAAATASSSSSSGPPQNTSSPAAHTSSLSPEFSFAEPALESINSDTSHAGDFATMNVDGNATIPSNDFDSSAIVPSRLNKKVQCPPQGGCEAQTQTDEIVILHNFDQWIEYSDWFKVNKHKVKPGVREHTVQDMNESWSVTKFCERHLNRGVSKSELKNLWNSDYSEDQVLLEEYRCLQEKTARSRYDWFWQLCDNPRPLPHHQPLVRGFDNREPCNSPNFHGCICCGETWSESEDGRLDKRFIKSCV